MKRKMIILIVTLSAIAALAFLCTSAIRSVRFFRCAQIQTNDIGSQNEHTMGLTLTPTLDLHQSLLQNQTKTKVFPNYFQNQSGPVQSSGLPIHIYLGQTETEELSIKSAIISDSAQRERLRIIWEITPKKKSVNLSRYDYIVTISGYFHWELKGGKNQMLIRYSNQNKSIWAQSPMWAAIAMGSDGFPSHYWSNYKPIINMRPDLVQLWSEGFYSIKTEQPLHIDLILTLSEKWPSKKTITVPLSWWSTHLLPANTTPTP